MQLAVDGHALDGLDRAAVGLHGEHEARPHGLAVDLHGARAADAVLASEVRADELEVVAQEVAEGAPHVDLALVELAVDADAHGP